MSTKGKSNKQNPSKLPIMGKLNKDYMLYVDFVENYTLETPFGLIQIRDSDIQDSPYGKHLPMNYNYEVISDRMEQKDYIGAAIFLEKEISKYPKVPLLYFDLAACFERLNEREKALEVIARNFQINKGLPMVDANYNVALNSQLEDASNIEFFKPSYFIHEAYPKQKNFHPDEVRDFYYVVGMYARSNKNLSLFGVACSIVMEVGGESKKVAVLKTYLYRMEYPRLSYVLDRLGIVVILGSIFGVFWLIYKLITWIF
jgi:tetratricopeptide (TPR) repeat protein